MKSKTQWFHVDDSSVRQKSHISSRINVNFCMLRPNILSDSHLDLCQFVIEVTTVSASVVLKQKPYVMFYEIDDQEIMNGMNKVLTTFSHTCIIATSVSRLFTIYLYITMQIVTFQMTVHYKN